MALVIRYGAAWPLRLRGHQPARPGLLWIGLVALQRGYEARFLGAGPEEYRRAGIAVPGTVHARRRHVVRAPAGRLARLRPLAVPLGAVFSLVGRHLLRAWIARLRVAGHGLQRVLVVGRATPPSPSSSTFRQEPQHGLLAVGACVPESAGDRGLPRQRRPGRRRTPTRSSDAVDASTPTWSRSSPTPTFPASRCGGSPGRSRSAASTSSSRRASSRSPVRGSRSARSPACRCCTSSGRRLGGGRMLVKTVFDRVLGVAAARAGLAGARGRRAGRPARPAAARCSSGRRGSASTASSSRCSSSARWCATPRSAGRAARADRGQRRAVQDARRPAGTRVGGSCAGTRSTSCRSCSTSLRGDMSLVGPRPPLPEEVAGYDDDAVPPAAGAPGPDRPLAGQRPQRPVLGGVAAARPALRRQLVDGARPADPVAAPAAPSSGAPAPTETRPELAAQKRGLGGRPPQGVLPVGQRLRARSGAHPRARVRTTQGVVRAARAPPTSSGEPAPDRPRGARSPTRASPNHVVRPDEVAW